MEDTKEKGRFEIKMEDQKAKGKMMQWLGEHYPWLILVAYMILFLYVGLNRDMR